MSKHVSKPCGAGVAQRLCNGPPGNVVHGTLNTTNQPSKPYLFDNTINKRKEYVLVLFKYIMGGLS